MNKKLWLAVLGSVVAGGVSGCRSTAMPSWSRGGPAEYQQSQAEQFDPYPETESGPSALGVRPLDYDKPPTEVRRVQPPRDYLRSGWLPWNWGRR